MGIRRLFRTLMDRIRCDPAGARGGWCSIGLVLNRFYSIRGQTFSHFPPKSPCLAMPKVRKREGNCNAIPAEMELIGKEPVFGCPGEVGPDFGAPPQCVQWKTSSQSVTRLCGCPHFACSEMPRQSERSGGRIVQAVFRWPGPPGATKSAVRAAAIQTHPIFRSWSACRIPFG